MIDLPAPIAKRISDRIRGFAGLQNCTAAKVQQVFRGDDLDDRFLQAAIERELGEYGLSDIEGGSR